MDSNIKKLLPLVEEIGIWIELVIQESPKIHEIIQEIETEEFQVVGFFMGLTMQFLKLDPLLGKQLSLALNDPTGFTIKDSQLLKSLRISLEEDENDNPPK